MAPEPLPEVWPKWDRHTSTAIVISRHREKAAITASLFVNERRIDFLALFLKFIVGSVSVTQ